MALDLSKIDEQIKRLQEIRRIASDPVTLALLEQLMANGKGGVQTTPEPQKAEQHLFDELTSESPKDEVAHAQRGAQVRAIRAAIAHFPDTFTVATIGNSVRDAEHQVTNVAIGKVLKRLEKSQEIEVVERGVGSNPNIYQKTAKFKNSGRNGR